MQKSLCSCNHSENVACPPGDVDVAWTSLADGLPDGNLSAGQASTLLAVFAALLESGNCNSLNFLSISASDWRRRFRASSTANKSESICLRMSRRALGALPPLVTASGTAMAESDIKPASPRIS